MSLITDSACDSSPVRCYNGQNPVTEQLLPLIWQHTTSASTFWQNEHTGIYGMSNTQPFPDNWLSHKNSSFLQADKHVPFTDTGAKRWLQTLNNALNTVMQPADPRSEAQYGKPQNQPPISLQLYGTSVSPFLPLSQVAQRAAPPMFRCVDAVLSLFPKSLLRLGVPLIQVLGIPWPRLLDLVHVLVDDVVETGLSESTMGSVTDNGEHESVKKWVCIVK